MQDLTGYLTGQTDKGAAPKIGRQHDVLAGWGDRGGLLAAPAAAPAAAPEA